MGNNLISSAIEYVRELFAGNSDGHGFDHAMRVYRNAVTIADGEECDATVVALAALLHDADDPKIFVTRDNANARTFLDDAGVGPETAERVIRAINSVSFSKNRGKTPETAEGRIVQDADRLDAIGAIGAARAFTFGGSRGRAMYDPDIPPKTDMNAEEYRKSDSTSLNHFYEKLFKLKDMMNTPSAKALAEGRDRFLHEFADEFLSEWSGER
jgi:uncharacterized protein